MTTMDLLRPEIRGLRAYEPASYEEGLVRLNANENPWPAEQNDDVALNRYPSARPVRLERLMATHYGVAEDGVVVTRGSSEAIDLTIRGFCPAGASAVMICPPTFGMYEVYARVQGATVLPIPLQAADGFRLPVEAILDAWDARCRLVFVCAPNNPTGTGVSAKEIGRLCAGIEGRGVVVLDGAYLEFATEDPTRALLDAHHNIIVLRTLSKAFGLAGIRCGALLADPGIAEALRRALPPYCLPSPVERIAERALQPEATREAHGRIARLVEERGHLAAALGNVPGIRHIWPSEANFLLVEVENPAAFVARARAGGVLVRDFSRSEYTPNCLRISIGTPEENRQLLDALQ